MKTLIADSGSTKTQWALIQQETGVPRFVQTFLTEGLNPLYVSQQQITDALRSVLGGAVVDELRFYGSGCSAERVPMVEQALRRAVTPVTRVTVDSDLMGAALALSSPSSDGVGAAEAPFIACIMGTGSIAAYFDPSVRELEPMPALGYILGDEGSGAWFGRHVLSDYLKHQMPGRVREAFEDDFGPVSSEQAIRHVYQQPCPNRYLATFAAFLGRHADFGYSQELSYRGIEAFWQRNVMRVDDCREVRLVGSVAYHLRGVIEQVASLHGYIVTRVLQAPIEGLI